MAVQKDFEEFFELLNKRKVRYCVVGAHAFAYHAKPRFTQDIDVLVEPDSENAEKVIEVLADFGFKSAQLTAKDFTKNNQVVQMGYKPVRIDLLTSIAGITFREAWKNRVVGKFGRQKIWVLGKKELIANKMAAGRPQDLADVRVLKGA